MAYTGKNADIAEQRVGRAGMVIWPNRLDSTPGQLIDAATIQFDDLNLRKEAGADNLDDNGLANNPSFLGTYTVASTVTGFTWLGYLAAYKGTASSAFVKALGSHSPSGSSTLSTITIPAPGVAADNLVVVGIAQRGGGDQVASVADSKGNTYTPVGTTATVGNGAVSHYFSRIVTPLVGGGPFADTITVTYTPDSSGLAFNCCAADEYTGVQASPLDRAQAGFGSGGGSVAKRVGPLAALSVIPSLLVDVDGANAVLADAPLAPAAGWVARSTAQNTSAGFELQVRMFSRVDTTSPVIIGLLDFNPQGAEFGSAPNTITTTKGSKVVTGSGATSFLLNVNPNDTIRIGNETHRVETVLSATVLHTAEAWFTTNVASLYFIRPQERLLTVVSDGNIWAELNADIDALLLTTLPTQSLVPGRWVIGGKESGPASIRKAFWFSGRDPVQVVDGTAALTTGNINSPPADWSSPNQPINGVFSGESNRLIGFGNLNDPHRLYFSLPSDHEDFLTTPFDQEVYSGIGDRLWCGLAFNGLLFFWKNPRGIFWIDDSDPSSLIVRKKSEALGCAPSPHAALSIDDDVLFMSDSGSFHLLSAVSDMGGARSSDLSYRLGLTRWLRENINLAKLDQVVSVWYPHRKQAYFGVPSAGQDTCDLILRFDFGGVDSGLDVRFAYSRRDSPGALAVRRESDTVQRPIAGEAGLVLLLDRDARNKNGLAYEGTWQTPHLDLTYAQPLARARKKTFEFVELVFEPVDSGTLEVQPYVDGVASGELLTFDPTVRRDRRKLNVADGHTISYRGTENTLNGDFEIDDIITWFKVTSEDESRGS